MICQEKILIQLKSLRPFDRHFEPGTGTLAVIGSGEIGGKAHGLAMMQEIIDRDIASQFAPEIDVNIPTLAVVATDCFDQFLEQNDLFEIAYSDMRDGQLALVFQQAELPALLVGDLRALGEQVHSPLAIRSSSMLEDAMFQPFAGVYSTKMIPNNQPEPDTRFRKLVEAIKFIYASTFFTGAKQYMGATRHTSADEKMAVVIQEVVGVPASDRYYPHVSGVARSYNYYPTGHAKPDQGIVELALGLGKSIVDDGVAWAYSPAFPKSNPPYNSIRDILQHSQLKFWAVNMGPPSEYDPINETEYMARYGLEDAEYDGTLKHIASTYRARDDVMVMGTNERGPRLIDFAPILKLDHIRLNDLLETLVEVCEGVLGSKVEVEFAITLNGDDDDEQLARFGFLQVRPMVVSDAEVDVSLEDLEADNVIVASDSVLGNGVVNSISDVVFVKPGAFSAEVTTRIPPQLEKINGELIAEERPYLLIGFGRWGTSDPSAGIPVEFSQISGAKVIVEATLPNMDFQLSQGSHFFQNVTSFKICYFSIRHWTDHSVDWDWLNSQSPVVDTEFVRHCRLDAPLEIRVDGKHGYGVIRHE